MGVRLSNGDGPVDLGRQDGVRQVGDGRQPGVGEQDQPSAALARQPGELEGVQLVAPEVEEHDDVAPRQVGQRGRPLGGEGRHVRTPERNGRTNEVSSAASRWLVQPPRHQHAVPLVGEQSDRRARSRAG